MHAFTFQIIIIINVIRIFGIIEKEICIYISFQSTLSLRDFKIRAENDLNRG